MDVTLYVEKYTRIKKKINLRMKTANILYKKRFKNDSFTTV